MAFANGPASPSESSSACGQPPVVAKLLLEAVVETDADDEHDMTSLHHAAINGKDAVARLLLETGATSGYQKCLSAR